MKLGTMRAELLVHASNTIKIKGVFRHRGVWMDVGIEGAYDRCTVQKTNKTPILKISPT